GWWLGFPGAADSNPALEAFRAQGRGGQVILIVPSKDLVIVRMGNNESSAGRRELYEWLGRIATAFPVIQ
ncbi:MAG: hypothetical protein GY788_13345, partial [bacterium]|nr:hypothetical protein [bacterium]